MIKAYPYNYTLDVIAKSQLLIKLVSSGHGVL